MDTIMDKIFDTNLQNIEIVHHRKSSILSFWLFFTDIDKIVILEGGLGTRKTFLGNRLKFHGVLRFSWNFLIFSDLEFKIIWQLVRQLLYMVLISNHHAPFHLWQKKNLEKYQKFSNIIRPPLQQFPKVSN